MLPVDAIVGRVYNEALIDHVNIDKIEEDDVIFDIGMKTIEKYRDVINNSQTIFVNGTAGKYEDVRFATGTRELLNAIGNAKAVKVIGGGDGVSAAKTFGFENKFTFLSTGGGATLEYIIQGSLPAIDNIPDE
jgi:phosphoglycerate kinase